MGPINYVVVVLSVGGTNPSDIKLVLQREPRTTKVWFPAGSILSNGAHVDAAVREMFEETCLTLTVHDVMMLSGNRVLIPLPARQHQLVHVFSTSVYVLCAIANLRTPTKVEQVVTSEYIAYSDCTYTVTSSVDIDWLSLTPSDI
jgi:8-oxo-dGTP pyrophosphatase MutT (NUDIX family)